MEKNFRFVYLSVYIHGFESLKNAVCKLGDWYVVEQTILRHHMDLSQVVYIIWTLKPVNYLRPAKEMAFLVPAAGFATSVTGQFMTWQSSSQS